MNEQTEPWRIVKRDDYTQRQTNIGVLIDGHVYELGDVNNERNRINAHLIAAAPELLAALGTCCIATQGKQKAFCECSQHDIKHCLDAEGVCQFGESGNCKIWKAIQKARGLQQ